MVELHIFDFDGTIFYSPVADPNAVAAALVAAGDVCAEDAATVAKELDGKLRNVMSSGGLGWYQSLSTLSPPAVPERPDESTWFVNPILAHIRAIVETRDALKRERIPAAGTHPAAPKADMPLIYVLTGRDVKYYDRIWTLLRQAGLDTEVEDVLLKPNETAGTVKYKLNRFFSLIQYHQPARVFYYEDRVEQGRRLLEGMRVLEEMLYMDSGAKYTETVNSVSGYWKADRVGVVTFDVAGGAAEAARLEEGKRHCGCQEGVRRGCDAITTAPSPTTVLHTPQPMVVPHTSRGGAACQGAEGSGAHLSTLVASLRASPYSLLRDACYPLDRRVLFNSLSPADSLPSTKVAAALSHAERQAQQWVEGTVRFYNAKSGSEGSVCREGGPPVASNAGASCRSKAKRAAAYNARALRAAVSFAVPPPFLFVMVLVPPALCGRSSSMLSSEQLVALLRTLEEEKRAADQKVAA
ncbi:hypothetical protein LSCM1_06119 [Leishmania martiniquensis]|uniref:Swiss Army Knife RNA repair protein HAD domain-containing protein n=1 Tax=Leishmania martiniquensis TaxID=1580590 RepID=A0A836KQ67_9TRYP|nr:hypothetical protein LSCM1_06119 [Leishmania martiniquensis]